MIAFLNLRIKTLLQVITKKIYHLIPLTERFPENEGKYIILSKSNCKTPLIRNSSFVEAKMNINVHPKTKEITKSFDVNNQEPIEWLELQPFNRKDFFEYRLSKAGKKKLSRKSK